MFTLTILLSTLLSIPKVSAGDATRQCICNIGVTDTLMQNVLDNTMTGSHDFFCEPAPGETFMAGRIQLDVDFTDDFFYNEPKLVAGTWFVQFPCDWIVDGQLARDKNRLVHPLSRTEIAALYNNKVHKDSNHTRHLRGRGKPDENNMNTKQAEHRRRLSSIGKKEYGIVIVHATDAVNPLTKANAETMMGITNKQFMDCSGGSLELVKKDDTVEVTLPMKIGMYNKANVDSHLFRAICQHYGYSSDCNISQERDLDHILFSMPFGLSNDVSGHFWAYASRGQTTRHSVYSGGLRISEGIETNGGSFIPGTIIHELGHNYQLGHARDVTDPNVVDPKNVYGDKTTHMGGGSATRKCFNGYNYYVLGWHATQTNEVALQPGDARTYNVKGIEDLATGGVVNIKVGKYYVTFNLKKGINRGIDGKGGNGERYTDEVLIHEGMDVHFGQSVRSSYKTTSLVGHLASFRDKYEVALENGNLHIELCSIDKKGSDGAMLSIGMDAASQCKRLGALHKPQGMRSLLSDVPVTGLSGKEYDLLEFKMQIPYKPESVTCSTGGSAATGDVELYMNFWSSPHVYLANSAAIGTNACLSYGPSSNQRCDVTNVKGTYLYVTIEGDSTFSGVTLECTVQGGSAQPPTPPPTQAPVETVAILESGVPKTNIAIAQNAAVFYTLPMPSRAESVSCRIYGGKGDADLYTRWDEEVSISERHVNTCVPYRNGSEEICDANKLGPLGSVLHIAVVAHCPVAGLALECNIATTFVTASTTSTTTATILATSTATTPQPDKPKCPNTSNQKVTFKIKNKKTKTIRCQRIAKFPRFCSKKLDVASSDIFNIQPMQTRQVHDVCVQECAKLTNVCDPNK